MTNVELYTLKGTATLQIKTEMEILKSAQYIVGFPNLGPRTVSADGKTIGGGDGTFSINQVGFARQAIAHPENFVPAFMGYVVMNAQVQKDGALVDDSVIAGIVAANLATVWK